MNIKSLHLTISLHSNIAPLFYYVTQVLNKLWEYSLLRDAFISGHAPTHVILIWMTNPAPF